MTERLVVIIASLFLALFLACSDGASKSNTNFAATPEIASSPDPTKRPNDPGLFKAPVSELCDRLDEIKKFRDTDPIYEALIAKGKTAMPCLIEKITDSRPMRDPREPPPFMYFAVGDAAVFILLDLTENDDLLLEMLPPIYRDEWESRGVYAYFSYVSEPGNRKELQLWWRHWLKDNKK